MKTLTRLIALALVSGSFATAIQAAPPSKRIPLSPNSAAVQPVSETNDKAPGAPTCAFMRNLTGGSKGPRYVRCTAETMKNDPRCRQMCEEVAKRPVGRDGKAGRPGSPS